MSPGGSAGVLQTSSATQSLPLSSGLPDTAFYELQHVGITSATGATMHLTVLGFIRTPSPSGQASVVTLITHIGRVILSGSELSYVDDTQAELFYNAGFPTSSSGSRRLLQVQTLFGLFNAVSSLSNTTTYAVPSPSLPDSFVMFARRRTPCIPHPVNGTDQPGPVPANFTGGAIPIVPGLDVCALLNINTSLLVVAADSTRYVWMTYTLYRHSATQLRVEYTHPFVPGTMLVEVLDNSNSSDPVQFSYQVNSADRGLGLVTSDTVAAVLSMNVSGDDIPMLVGPVSHFTQVNVTQTDLVGQMLGASMDYMGDTTIAGEPVRIWAVHLNNDTFTAFWYDSVADEQARRIAFGDFGELDVLRLVPLPGDAPSNSYLYNPPTEGITVMLDAQENMATTDAVTLPTKLSLDPFAPYAAAFKLEALNLSAAAPSPPSQATRRRLQQASLVPPAFLGAHRSVLLRPNYGNSTGRHLLQSVGACAASNVCPVTVNLLCGSSCSPSSYNNQAITQPFGPVTFVVGPVNAVPCLYQFSAGIPIDPPVLSIGGTLAVQLCANQQGFSYASGTLGLSIGLPIDGAVASTATSPFTWNIVSITVGLYNNPVPETCSNNQPSSAGISTSGASSRALAHLSSLYGNNDARSSCGCLQSIIASTMAGFTINGPDSACQTRGRFCSLFLPPQFPASFYRRSSPPSRALTCSYRSSMQSSSRPPSRTIGRPTSAE